MATTDQLVIKAKLILSRRSDTTLDATIINELGLAQERLEREAWLPQFLFNVQTISPVVASSVDLESQLTRYLRLYNRSAAVRVINATQTEAQIPVKRFDDLEQLKQLYPGDLGTGSFVKGYWLADSLMELRPRPSLAVPQDLSILFYQGEASLPAVGNSNLWTQKASDYLLGEAGTIIAQSLRDDKALALFQKIRADDRARLYKQDVAKDEDDLDRSMGDED